MIFPDQKYNDNLVAANIKHAVGTADQLTDDLSLCRKEGRLPASPSGPSDKALMSLSNNKIPLVSMLSTSSYFTAKDSTKSFNSAAFLANIQQKEFSPVSSQQSVLWNLPDNEYDSSDEFPKAFPTAHTQSQKVKKLNKRFGIVNIGKNVAKYAFFDVLLFNRSIKSFRKLRI